MLMMLLDGSHTEPELGERTLGALARLGVTTVSLLRDEQMVGVVLEGWAFDPARSAEAARTAIAGAESGVQVLHPLRQLAVPSALAQMAVSATTSKEDLE